MNTNIVLSFCTLALLTATGCKPERSSTATQTTSVATAPAHDNTSSRSKTAFDESLEQLDTDIGFALARSEKQPTGWLALQQAASLHMQRARLSGNYDDYQRAQELIEQGFAKTQHGLLLSRAQLNFTLHRLDAAATDIATVMARPADLPANRRNAQMLLASLDFQSGRYLAAKTGFEAVMSKTKTPTVLAQLGLFYWKTGDFDKAEQFYREAMGKYHGKAAEPRAWYHLQLGLMDLERGRLDDALAHYKDAQGELPGYWLVDEHIAEIATLQGRTDAAMEMYVDIIARTGNPEFMDAIAAILAERGQEAESQQWVQRARAVYERQLARFPEAAAGHALQHFIEFGEAPRALALAEANVKTRPNAEAKRLLAEALLKAKSPQQAKTAIEEALATAWNTADLHATAARVYEACGEAEPAAKSHARAREINPSA